jgi:excisionase family DNA binding protein
MSTKSNPLFESPSPAIAPLALRPRDAAAMLGISVSSLERLTKAGELPRFKDGNKVFYRVASLDAWLARREATSTVGEQQAG